MRSWKGLYGSFAGLAIVALALTGNGCSGDDTTPTGTGGGPGSDAGDAGPKGGSDAGPNVNKGGSDAATAEAGDAAEDATTQDVLSDALQGAGGSSAQPDAQGSGGTTTEAGAGGSIPDSGLGGSNAGGSNTGGTNAGGSTPDSGAGGSNAGGSTPDSGLGGANAGGSTPDSGLGGANAGGSNTGGTNAGGTNVGGTNAGGTNAGGTNAGGTEDAGEPDSEAGQTGGNDAGQAGAGGGTPGTGGTVDAGLDADAATISYLCTWDFDQFPDGSVSGGSGSTDVCGITQSRSQNITGGDGILSTVNDGTAPGSTKPGCLQFEANFALPDAQALAGSPRGSVRLRQVTAQSINWTAGRKLHAWVKVTVPGSTATIGLIVADNAGTPNFVRGPAKPIAELPTDTWVQLDFEIDADASTILAATSRFGIEIVPQDVPESEWQSTTVRLDNLWID